MARRTGPPFARTPPRDAEEALRILDYALSEDCLELDLRVARLALELVKKELHAEDHS